MNEVKILVTISVLLISAVFINQAFAVTTTDDLFICQSPEGASTGKPPIIALTNLTDGSYISIQNITVAGLSIRGCNGMAVDPTDGTFYAIVTHSANLADRHLITLDPTTGLGTDIGGMGNRYATLGFLADGSLRTVSGNADASPEIYHSVNKATGQTTALCPLPAIGADEQGQMLALNYDDNKIYHMRGSLTATTNNTLSTVDIESPSPTNCGITVVANPTTPTTFPVFGTVGEIFSLAYNTNDGFFYGYSFDKFWSMTSLGNMTLIKASPNNLIPPEEEMKGMAFTIILAVDTTNPVITTTVPEPIPIPKNSVFNEFQFMSCIDDTDGDITNSMTTVGTVDTSKPKSYFVDYTCTDVATNSATLLNVHYVVKRSATGSGGTAPSAPALAPTAPAPTVDRALSLFDQLNSLFDFRDRAEPAPAIPDLPDAVPDQRPSFVDAIRNFFASLFG